MLQKKEIELILPFALFAVIWISIVLPYLMQSTFFLSLNPIFQYTLFNIGFISFTIASFGLIFSIVLDKKVTLSNLVKNGMGVWFGFSFVLDMWQPPYYIDFLGNPVYSTSEESLTQATIDAFWYEIFNIFIPQIKTIIVPFFNISLLFIAIYLIVPLSTLVGLAMLFSQSKFTKWVGVGS